MKKALAQFIFHTLWGFHFETVYPKVVKKWVIAIMPHTSNWDFLIGVLVRPIIDLDSYYAGKSSLFKFPFGGLMRWLGGVPVDRTKHNNFVDAVAAQSGDRQRDQREARPVYPAGDMAHATTDGRYRARSGAAQGIADIANDIVQTFRHDHFLHTI